MSRPALLMCLLALLLVACAPEPVGVPSPGESTPPGAASSSASSRSSPPPATTAAPVTTPAPRSPSPSASVSTVQQHDLDRVVAAGGQRQWIRCRGTGSPTVVVVSGLGAASSMWSQVLPGFDAMSRTCVYDRPGLGRSPARSGPARIDAGTHARELRALLAAVGEPGPYLLVGHSYGGLVVRAFARTYPTTVSAVLLVEGVYPGIQADYWAPYRHDWREGGTVIDMAASAAADGDGPHLGNRPLIVITAADPEPGAPAWVVRLWNRRQREASALSLDSVHVLALHSGHVVQRDQQAVVMEAVRELLAAVRESTRLPRCDRAWTAVGARCLPG